MLRALREYFEEFSRSQMRRHRKIAAHLREGFEFRRNIEFYQRVGARFKSFPSAPPKKRDQTGSDDFHTVGFVLESAPWTRKAPRC